MRLLRCGSAILVAGAGNREVARCDGGDISWQAQYFARVRRVDGGKIRGRRRESGGCELWNVAVTLGLARRLEGLESRNCLTGLRDVCAPMGVSAGLLEEVSCETFVLRT